VGLAVGVVVGAADGVVVGSNVAQMFVLQLPLMQSLSSLHFCPMLQPWHVPPPQSPSVSSPFKTPSKHDDAVGRAVGEPLGPEEGENVGVEVGVDDGLSVGAAVGSDVGEPLGLEEGDTVGVEVGASLQHSTTADTPLQCDATAMQLATQHNSFEHGVTSTTATDGNFSLGITKISSVATSITA
jgi:hypothetical protein